MDGTAQRECPWRGRTGLGDRTLGLLGFPECPLAQSCLCVHTQLRLNQGGDTHIISVVGIVWKVLCIWCSRTLCGCVSSYVPSLGHYCKFSLVFALIANG